MATVKDPVDVVIVGMGWTGAILAKELTDEGLQVVALERGADRDTQPDFAHPRVLDELEGSVHRRYLQSLNKETVTIRHGLDDVAVPYRRWGRSSPAPASAAPARIGRAAISARCRKISNCAAIPNSASENASFPTA